MTVTSSVATLQARHNGRVSEPYTVIFDDAAGVQEPPLEGVGSGRGVAGQAAAQRGADGVGQDRQHDVEVDIERDRAGERVQSEGLDGFGEALLDVHPPGIGADDLPGRSWGRLVISRVGWS